MKRSQAGLTQIYTGDGKGKSTAAFGLAVRAAGSGRKVCIYQFIKGYTCGEHKALRKLGKIKIELCGRGCFIKEKPGLKDVERAVRGFERARATINSGKYDIVILDEINVAMGTGLLKIADVLSAIREKPAFVELVLTGRRCPKSLLAEADLVTEMRKIKHPFDRGIIARRGIEY
ncbi:MAG: cob(I)yrinic acid a,c-diamide adenosyltransferase [Candidatus Omnitrophota bacterium]